MAVLQFLFPNQDCQLSSQTRVDSVPVTLLTEIVHLHNCHLFKESTAFANFWGNRNGYFVINCELIGQKCCLEWTCNERENDFGDLSSVTWLLEMITEKDVNNGSANIDLQERYQI